MDDNPYKAPIARSTAGLRGKPDAPFESRFVSGVACLAIIANGSALPLVCLVGWATFKADTSPREQMQGGAAALALAAAIGVNLYAIINRRRIDRHSCGIVVAINIVMAALPVLWLVDFDLAYGAWGVAFLIWSFIALTIAALALAAKEKKSLANPAA